MSESKGELCCRRLPNQNDNVPWSLAPDHPGDVSTATRAYLTLKRFGFTEEELPMLRARGLVENLGGIARMNLYFHLDLPQALIDIYTISS